jgi:ribosomal-protein-alanine N-acetyltransferase
VSIYHFRLSNKQFLQPYEPIRPEYFYTIEGQREKAKHDEEAFAKGNAYPCGIFERHSETLVGRIELSGVVRGPFQNAYLGYSIDEAHNGLGYATEAVNLILQFAFDHVELHRVQAATLPISTLDPFGFSTKMDLDLRGSHKDT